jgi:lysophospholipase
LRRKALNFLVSEFGSYDPYLSAFVNVTFLGTHLNAGTPDNSTGCTQWFDNFGFVIGSSSSLFNAIVNMINEASTSDSIIATAIQALLSRLTNGLEQDDNDVANYPNPFQGLNPGVYQASELRQLQIVDGGENGENVSSTFAG